MSYLIVLRHIRVENANAITGLTYGFPAITHFLGFTHALSRKLQQSHNLKLENCGVICHNHQLHAHQSDPIRDKVFALTRNPLTKESKTAAFNEEGRMHMTVSLLIECSGEIAGDTEANELEQYLLEICPTQRLAGGIITEITKVNVIAFPQEKLATRKLMRRLLPGFALLDRSELLAKHYEELKQDNPQAEMIDAWLDFSTIKMRAIPTQDDKQPEIGDPAYWEYIPKPASGYLVPLMTGYQAISPLYSAGKVDKTRDPNTPFRFVEAIYGVGEWKSPHRINDIRQLLWCYDYQEGEGIYRCCNQQTVSRQSKPNKKVRIID
ncbi:type I-F CRISPR-associated protein Csy2 [Photorhabdus luminescens]|uniref:Type I-F CRISPR-associated protein Csy2 n=1 Tax=Photorhabdus akhurstii TaxID=171438 RepID=A0ABX8LTR2_9GAMM|nr:type I-F CRISPR-associated protein Csy2 [Photorhabdus akhurstii]QXF33320.1 type I-F CRISPR-associated protein Csy2 [Photorhabdus akhurstii]UJD75116.1 type I-F CRISPR-associated protein Csy2 [Photorhabdus luminescens]